jgi:hypothetical protein
MAQRDKLHKLTDKFSKDLKKALSLRSDTKKIDAFDRLSKQYLNDEIDDLFVLNISQLSIFFNKESHDETHKFDLLSILAELLFCKSKLKTVPNRILFLNKSKQIYEYILRHSEEFDLRIINKINTLSKTQNNLKNVQNRLVN